MALIEGPVGNASYDVLRLVFARAVKGPAVRRQMVREIECRAQFRARRRMARLLVSGDAVGLILSDDAAGMGLFLLPAAATHVDPLTLGKVAIDAVRGRADRTTQLAFAQLDQLRVVTGGTKGILQELEALKDGQAAVFDRLCDALQFDAGTADSADPRTADFRVSELDRDDDIDQLWTEIEGSVGGYVVVQAGPWAGKTALMAEVAADPPAGIDVISFFVRAVGRRNTAEHFLDVVNSQLCRLLERRQDHTHDLASRRSAFERLWAEAVESSADRNRLVVLLVDGLDEQDHAAEVPISALLPVLRPSSARVLIATRPNPRRLPELSSTHPYYGACEHPFVLSPSPAAQAVAQLADDTIGTIVLSDYEAERRLLGILTVADGPLTASDLETLLGCNRLELERLLGGLERNLLGDGSDERPWELGHVELLRTAREQLTSHSPRTLEECEALIDRWADYYADEGWPTGSPAYLLESYPGTLIRRRLPRRIAWLVSSEYLARHQEQTRTRRWLLDATDAALAIYCSSDTDIGTQDVAAICIVGLRRGDLLNTVAAISPGVIAGWSRAQNWIEVDRLLGQASSDAQLVEAIQAAAFHTPTADATALLMEHVARLRNSRARSEAIAAIMFTLDFSDTTNDMARVEPLLEQITHPSPLNDALVTVAHKFEPRDPTAALKLLSRAETAAHEIEDPYDRSTALRALAGGLARLDPGQSMQVLREAEDAANEIGVEDRRSWALHKVAESVASLAETDHAALSHAVRIIYGVEAGSKDLALLRVIERVAVSAPSQLSLVVPLADTIEDVRQRQSAWHRIANALRGSGSSEAAAAMARARQLAEGLDHPWDKARALSTLAEDLVSDDPEEARTTAEQAHDVALEIPDVWDRDDALKWVVGAFAKQIGHDSGASGRAIEIANSIEDPHERGQAFASLAWSSQAGAEDVEYWLALSERSAEQIKPPWAMSWVLTEVVDALAKEAAFGRGSLRLLERTAEAIPDANVKCEAWARIASSVPLSDTRTAARAIARAQELVATVTHPMVTCGVLSLIAKALVRHRPGEVGELLEQISLTAHDIDDDVVRCYALLDLARAQAPVDPAAARSTLGQTSETAHTLTETWLRDRILRLIVDAYLAADHRDSPITDASTLASTIEDPLTRCEALLAIATALRESHPSEARKMLDVAVELIESTNSPKAKSAALAVLATTLRDTNIEDALDALVRAYKTVDDIETGHDTAEALGRIVTAMINVDTGDLAMVEQIARSISDQPTRSNALLEIALAYAPADAAQIDREKFANAQDGAPECTPGEHPAATDDAVNCETWRHLARLAREPGFLEAEIFPALISAGGVVAGQAVAQHILHGLERASA